MRLVLGDTKVVPETLALLPDETYTAKLTALGETEATASLAESLATRFAQEPDSISEDGDQVSWRDRVKTWLEIARRLRIALAETVSAASNTLYVAKLTREGDEGSEYRRPEWWTP